MLKSRELYDRRKIRARSAIARKARGRARLSGEVNGAREGGVRSLRPSVRAPAGGSIGSAGRCAVSGGARCGRSAAR